MAFQVLVNPFAIPFPRRMRQNPEDVFSETELVAQPKNPEVFIHSQIQLFISSETPGFIMCLSG